MHQNVYLSAILQNIAQFCESFLNINKLLHVQNELVVIVCMHDLLTQKFVSLHTNLDHFSMDHLTK